MGEWRITTARVEAPSAYRPRDESEQSPREFVERFGRAVDIPSLAVRTRLRGDRFQPLGMSGTKKLKDFMIDEKVPGLDARLRTLDRHGGGGIAWVVGWRIAEWAKVDDDDRECLEIRVERAG